MVVFSFVRVLSFEKILIFFVFYSLICTFVGNLRNNTRRMFKKYILLMWLFGSLPSMVNADDHTRFMDLPLSLSPTDMIEELQNRGLAQYDVNCMTGRISGLDVRLLFNNNKDTSAINSMLLTTQYLQGRSQRDDYKKIMKWMKHHYGKPNWESTVRGHAFARWYLGFDRDIVMIATAKQSVEVWFYDNHAKRNIDYYSILKYCERNPSEDVPYMTAKESVTWRSTSVPTVRKPAQVKGKSKKKGRVLKASKSYQRAKAKARKSRRRR